ncbi:N utilization substance protein B [Weizmannia acidilactici]|uniref:Transcription antitermination protein NusB n=2 Tax=Weizmannia acidilactici TaxID=2607726 RepID=A0A5J4JD79_9BACI|nr:N utilization substance protein B [Weizmannia acidilactici]GER69229.1 N utilization substance protein B [Weizmannia acidilactici]GER72444.1 N utilization substance protein B [Weizmannia acidilactici]
MMKRRTAREKALQAIFQIDMNKEAPEEAVRNVLNGQESDEYLEKLVKGTAAHLAEIDGMISRHLEHWTLDRLAKVDLNILRLAAYELMYAEDVPANVAINEALEISKRFADEKSAKFINGVLNNMKNTIQSS